MNAQIIQSVIDSSDLIHQQTWDEWLKFRRDFGRDWIGKPQPLAEDSTDKRVLDMIVLMIAVNGVPPKACDVVRAMGIPNNSKSLVYTSIEWLRRNGFLCSKQDAERFAYWGKQAILVPFRQPNGEPYFYRNWPVARKSAKRRAPAKKSLIQTKLL